MSRPAPPTRAAYPVFREITTRWMDNDVYGHVNNAAYYSFFDTAVSGWLFETGAVDYRSSRVVGLVVDSQCSYFAPLAFPDRIVAGVRAERVGNTSVAYGVGLFRNDEDVAAAAGRFVHVYVDRETNVPEPLSAEMRAALSALTD